MQSPMATSAPTSNKMQLKKANLKQKTGRVKGFGGPGRVHQRIK